MNVWQQFAQAVLDARLEWKKICNELRCDTKHLKRRCFNAAARGDVEALKNANRLKIRFVARKAGITAPFDDAETSPPVERSPLSDLRPYSADIWRMIQWNQDEDRKKEILDLYRAASQVLTLHDRLDSWMMPEAMHQWWQRHRLEASNFSVREKDTIAMNDQTHRERSLEARKNSDHHLRLLAAPGTFKRAALERGGPDWISELANTARKKHEVVSLSIATAKRWRVAQDSIAAQLGRTGWHKITVIDEKIAIYWPNPETYLYTREATEVQKFQAAVKQALGDPDSLRATQNALDNIAKRKS